MRGKPRILALCAVGAALAAARLSGQTTLDGREELASDRPEAWAMRWFAAALAPSGFGAAESTDPGRVDLALDAAWLPDLSERQRTVGFDGTKVEDLNRAPAAPRARARFGLPAGFSLDLGWIPPIRFDGARANLLSLGLARPLLERGPWRLGARLTGTVGRLDGDFTCPAAAAGAGADPVRNPYGCERKSEDQVDLNQVGFELGLAYRSPARPALGVWLGGALRRVDSTFHVRADWNGIHDRTRLDYTGNDWDLAAGLSWRMRPTWESSAELRWTPLDVVRTGGGGAESDPLLQVLLSLAYRLR